MALVKVIAAGGGEGELGACPLRLPQLPRRASLTRPALAVLGLPVPEPLLGVAVDGHGGAVIEMTKVIPRSRSRKLNAT